MIAAVAVWLGMSMAKVEAAEVVLPDVGVSFSIPENWRHEVKKEPGRIGIQLKPSRDIDASNVVRCRIDRHDLPERFRRYTQKELNGAYAAQPLDAAGFTSRLSAVAGMPVLVGKHGQAMFGDALAYWAQSTASETRGAASANFVSKTYLSQTPGFAWNVQCSGGTTSGASKAETTYKQSEATFEAFFSSIRFVAAK
jgi:hypothetical protein